MSPSSMTSLIVSRTTSGTDGIVVSDVMTSSMSWITTSSMTESEALVRGGCEGTGGAGAFSLRGDRLTGVLGGSLVSGVFGDLGAAGFAGSVLGFSS